MKPIVIAIISLLLISSATAQYNPPGETATDRFLRYVKIDTQSNYDADSVPSTDKQCELAVLLADELKSLGAINVYLSEYCIVYALVPGNLDVNSKVPVLGLIAHLDTSPDVSGYNVIPVIHYNYDGSDIVLNGDKSLVISPESIPVLKKMIGDDIITSDGTTLLGADDKAGCAEIMTLVDVLKQNPQIKHGDIAIAFTSDEEVGTGIGKFNIELFGADFAYTIDGSSMGEINNETWSAREVTVNFHGKNVNPGYAKNKLKNSAFAAADFISRFPEDMLPETTSGRKGYMHPYYIKMTVELSEIKVLLRDFEIEGLNDKERIIRDMLNATEKRFPEIRSDINFRDEYVNMMESLKDYPELTEYVITASRKAGIEPHLVAVRGGTDGSVLTERGLPCPNIFAGFENAHSKLEFTSRKNLEKTTETLVNLVQIFAGMPER